MISARTRAALAPRKARRWMLGNPEKLSPEARRPGAATRARAFADLRTVAASALRSQGLTLRAVAAGLEQHDFTTRQGGS